VAAWPVPGAACESAAERRGWVLGTHRFSREFDRRLERWTELPRIRLHDLRHTWATLALAAGEHPKVVAERLGHSNISVTIDTYSHVSQPMASDAAERVEELIFGRPV
jgi:integrase